MLRTSSLETPNAIARTSAPASGTDPRSAPPVQVPVPTLRDTFEGPTDERGTGGQNWSMFATGNAAKPSVDEPKFLLAHDAFWDAMRTDNVKGVQQILRGLSVLQRERLLRSPSPEIAPDVWAPKLPLCRVVALGQLAMTEALLDFHADPWVGDAYVGGEAGEAVRPATTPAYWGVLYGKQACLRAIYKTTRSTLEARRGLCQAVHADVLKWLVDKGVTPEQLKPAMRAAVERDDDKAVLLLARIGKADVNAVCALSDTQTENGSLLALAVSLGRIEAASALVASGAKAASGKTDAAPKGQAAEERFPLTQAIRKGHVALVVQMLHAGARKAENQPVQAKGEPAPPPVRDAAYLLAAFDAPEPVQMYMSLYRAGLQPLEVVDAEAILERARDKELDYLYAFANRQRSLLLLSQETNGNDVAKKQAKAALDALADALCDSPGETPPTPFGVHARAMTLDAVMPTRSIFNIFQRRATRTTHQAGNALAQAAVNAITPNFGMNDAPLMLGM